MQQMLQQVLLKDLVVGDDSSSNSDDGIKTGKIPVLGKLRAINWKKLAIIAGIIIIIVIIIHTRTQIIAYLIGNTTAYSST